MTATAVSGGAVSPSSDREKSPETNSYSREIAKEWWQEQETKADIVVSKDLSQYPFACEHCTETYASQFSLDRHVRMRHKSPRRLACNRCSERFASQESLDRHWRAIHVDEEADWVPGGFSQWYRENKEWRLETLRAMKVEEEALPRSDTPMSVSEKQLWWCEAMSATD